MTLNELLDKCGDSVRHQLLGTSMLKATHKPRMGRTEVLFATDLSVADVVSGNVGIIVWVDRETFEREMRNWEKGAKQQ